MKRVYVVGTADTKGEELAFLADAVVAAGARVTRVDVGTRGALVPVDVQAREVAAHHPDGTSAVLMTNDRGAAVTAMGTAFTRFIESRDDKDVWSTVGVSENVIEASWLALVDSVEYKLFKDAESN